MKYDYRQALVDDIKDWIINDTDIMEDREQFESHSELSDWIYDEIYSESGVTGNGIQWYGTERECSEYISDNFDLIYEALHEFCVDENVTSIIKYYESKSLARYFDCIIRCYLLGECIEKAMEELNL